MSPEPSVESDAGVPDGWFVVNPRRMSELKEAERAVTSALERCTREHPDHWGIHYGNACDECWAAGIGVEAVESDRTSDLAKLLHDKVFHEHLLATAGHMETQWISPECRTNRTVDGAWDEAVRRLREIYDAQVTHDPAITLGLSIGRQTVSQRDAATTVIPPERGDQ